MPHLYSNSYHKGFERYLTCSVNKTIQLLMNRSFLIIPQQELTPLHGRLCSGGAGESRHPPSTHTLPPVVTLPVLRAPSNISTNWNFAQKPSVLSPAYTSLVRENCVYGRCWPCWSGAPGSTQKAGRERKCQIHIDWQTMMSLVLHNPPADSKVHQNPADPKTFLNHCSLDMVYGRTVWNGTSQSTTLGITYKRSCTTCWGWADPKNLFRAEVTCRALPAFWALCLKCLFMSSSPPTQHKRR